MWLLCGEGSGLVKQTHKTKVQNRVLIQGEKRQLTSIKLVINRIKHYLVLQNHPPNSSTCLVCAYSQEGFGAKPNSAWRVKTEWTFTEMGATTTPRDKGTNLVALRLFSRGAMYAAKSGLIFSRELKKNNCLEILVQLWHSIQIIRTLESVLGLNPFHSWTIRSKYIQFIQKMRITILALIQQ